LSAIASGVTAGVNASFLKDLKLPQADITRPMLTAATSSVITQGVAVLTDLQESFSWRQVAISAVAAPLVQYVGDNVSGITRFEFLGDMAGSLSGSLLRRAFDENVETEQMWADAFGNALGNSIAREIEARSIQEFRTTAQYVLDEVQITPRYIGPDAAVANARLDNNPRSSISDPAMAMMLDDVSGTGPLRIAPGGGREGVLVQAPRLTEPQKLLYDSLISPWRLLGPKNEYEAMAAVDLARHYDVRYETSASIQNDRALINMGLMTIGGAAAGVFGAALYPTVASYSTSPLLSAAASGAGGDVAFQAYQNALFAVSDGYYGRSGIDGTELALSAGLGALPLLPAAIRGWADDLRSFGVPDWNIKLAPPGNVYTGSVGLELERIGGVELFKNQLPNRLAAELREAAAVGVRPIRVDDPGFDKVVNEDTIKFVITEGNELLIVPHTVRQTEISHAVLAQGRPVLAAGEAAIAGTSGKYVGMTITPYSGHYLNGASVAQSALSESRARDAFARFGIVFPD
jgi:hypothetical protein